MSLVDKDYSRKEKKMRKWYKTCKHSGDVERAGHQKS